MIDTSQSQIIHGDCLKMLAKLREGSIDLVFADPPFNIGYRYDGYDDAKKYDDYVDWTRQWMTACARVLKPTGSMYIAIGDAYAAEVRVLGRQLGLPLRNWIIWHYNFGQNMRRRFSLAHTHIFYFVKDEKLTPFHDETVRFPSARHTEYGDRRAHPLGRVPDDVWNEFQRLCGTFKEREGWHGCQMPESILMRIIRASSLPGEIVLDPFSGSGTTASAAAKLGRIAIGIDQSAEYAEHGRKRLAESQRLAMLTPGTASARQSSPCTTGECHPSESGAESAEHGPPARLALDNVESGEHGPPARMALDNVESGEHGPPARMALDSVESGEHGPPARMALDNAESGEHGPPARLALDNAESGEQRPPARMDTDSLNFGEPESPARAPTDAAHAPAGSVAWTEPLRESLRQLYRETETPRANLTANEVAMACFARCLAARSGCEFAPAELAAELQRLDSANDLPRFKNDRPYQQRQRQSDEFAGDRKLKPAWFEGLNSKRRRENGQAALRLVAAPEHAAPSAGAADSADAGGDSSAPQTTPPQRRRGRPHKAATA